MENLIRYSVIHNKNPREIVLLRGRGCIWKRCTFCDYHLDRCDDDDANFALNREVLNNVTGLYNHLEVINSGSFFDLDESTMDEILHICREKNINMLHFESHWMHRHEIASLREKFCDIDIRMKIGVETFDSDYREKVLCKGIGVSDPAVIAEFFDECCLLFGLDGQTELSMKNDIETGLAHFDRVCVNIMEKNSTPVVPDPEVIGIFTEKVAPLYMENPRVDILIHNTDFGVGGAHNDE